MLAEDVFIDEKIHLSKLHDLVSEAIREEKLLTGKLIELENDVDTTTGQRIADKIAEFGGSWFFILSFLGLLGMWILVNAYFLREKAFDPFPFILLNLILSCVAALQAPLIMMSQNRQEAKDRRRGRSDYMVNMKAEMEVRNLHAKVDLLMAEQMQHLFRVQQAQLDLLAQIDAKLAAQSKQA